MKRLMGLVVLATVLAGCAEMAIQRAGVPTVASVWPEVRADVADAELAAQMDAAVASASPLWMRATWGQVRPGLEMEIQTQPVAESVRKAKLERVRRMDVLIAAMADGGDQ